MINSANTIQLRTYNQSEGRQDKKQWQISNEFAV